MRPTDEATTFSCRQLTRITAFAGSMKVVWIHAGPFTVWMVFLEKRAVVDTDSGCCHLIRPGGGHYWMVAPAVARTGYLVVRCVGS
jgi:hypothetical protein